ncbi:hypothetical protein RIF29_28451 [Crotalaria pallida]|uniref:Aminotransferase-like plant mobile domain-containing protein n=1 Tax=Crotalaria pallida TaxID=3830 RepID=A0AAN9EDP1_CROPI
MDVQYRAHLESLRIDQVRWRSFVPEHRLVRPFEPISFYSGWLIVGKERVAYLPERDMRQLGHIQGIPCSPPLQCPDFEEIIDAWAHWNDHVVPPDSREQHMSISGEVVDGYLDWLHQYSHPYLLHTSRRVINPGILHG